MRRPGNLAGLNYWFGSTEPSKPSMVTSKLEEIRLANIANKTPLSDKRRAQVIADHLANPRSLMKKT